MNSPLAPVDQMHLEGFTIDHLMPQGASELCESDLKNLHRTADNLE